MQIPAATPVAAAAPAAAGVQSTAPKKQEPQAARVVTVQPIQRAAAKPQHATDGECSQHCGRARFRDVSSPSDRPQR